LGNSIGNWHHRKQKSSKQPFWLFYFYETARQTVSIFTKRPTKDNSEGLTES
jgi:hypothetical protein